MILKSDLENERITLGYKQKKTDPWENIDKRYQAGMKVRGKVTRIEEFGVLLSLRRELRGSFI